MCPFLGDSGLCIRGLAWCQLTQSVQGLPSKALKIWGSSSLFCCDVDFACPVEFQMVVQRGFSLSYLNTLYH